MKEEEGLRDESGNNEEIDVEVRQTETSKNGEMVRPTNV